MSQGHGGILSRGVKFLATILAKTGEKYSQLYYFGILLRNLPLFTGPTR